jgi:RNA polymerase sigma-70 factor (ECF subfamily)
VTTDQELVERVQAGDVQAFAALVERYERSVLAVVQAELRDPKAARKVAKRTLVRAFGRLSKLDDGSQFGPWLLKLARRQSINAVRAMPTAVGAKTADGKQHDGYDPEWIEHEHMLGLVTRLPDEDRRLIGLRYFDNHTLPEIAALVGYPMDQVTRRISLAHMRLQYWWSREQEL